MRKAIIDLGTNTFNLLIGELDESGLTIIHSEKIPVMLGMGGINEGRISPDAYQRGLEAIRTFKDSSESFDIQSIKGIATSAVRSAVNGPDFIQDVKDQTGVEIVMIDGKAEAELIFKGVSLTTEMNRSSVIMDIGGGSTEFIHVVDGSIAHIDSLNIGVSRIYQILNKPADFTSTDLNTIGQFIEEQAEGHFEFNCDILIGASGTFETFYEMIHQRRFVCDGKAHPLEWKLFNETLEWAIESSLEERNAHPWIVDMRKGMLPIGAFKIKWIIEKLGVKEVWLSPYSLKEGAFVS